MAFDAFRTNPAWLALALVIGACADGAAGDEPSGGAGSGASGAAGTGAPGVAGVGAGGSTPSGAAGTNASGAAGDAAPTGAAGTGGAAGDTGAAGSAPTGAAGGAPPTTVSDGPTGHAFDWIKGALNVDYAGYLPRHDIVYNTANTNPLYGLTVGNGRVGAMVWSQNGLTMQVGGVDASQQAAFSGGMVNINTTPALDAGGGAFQQRLALHDGILSTKYGQDGNARTVTIIGVPNSEVIGIHVADARPGVTAVTVELSLWDVSMLGNNGNVPSLDTWKKVTTYADAAGAGLSRGQTDANKFGYTLGATVEGTAFTTQMVDPNRVRLTITPGQSYTIWIACASRLNAPANDSVAEAKGAVAKAKTAGYAPTLAAYQAFWHGFWAKSFVQYQNAGGDADYLENAYYLTTYMIAAGGTGNYPFHFINGVFRSTQDKTKWSNAYWWWNQRDVYASFLASNHPEIFAVENRMYSRNADALKAFTMSRYQIDGIWVPETMGWNGNADGTTGSDYTKNIFSTGTEAALSMVDQYAYTGDADYLKTTAYPFMRDVAKFYVKKFTKDAASGKYVMESSNSHETYWNVRNAITDLAAVRSLFPIAIKTSTTLGLDAPLRAQWQDLLDNLTAYPTEGGNYVPHQPPISQTRNNENVASELIWPYNVTGIDAPDYAMAVSTWRARPFPYGNVWALDAIQAARLGLGDDANAGMKTMLQKYQNYPNGFTNNTNGVFEYLGVHLSVMNESLLHSYNDRLRVFPALPKDTSLVTRFTLAARGGFLVTAEREGGDIKYVGLKSLLGNAATVVNPWSATNVQVRQMGVGGSGSTIMTSSSATVTFNTVAGGVYVIERVAKPFSGYAYSVVRAAGANQGLKRLATNTTLGIGAAP